MNIKRTKTLTLRALFVALIAVGAFIRIPIPYVPFTLQYLFTMLAGLFLGAGGGAMAVAVYVLLGLIGLPIFTAGGGIGYVVQPTFGYLLGFILGTFVTGLIAHRGKLSYGRLLVANFTGLAIVYALGTVYYYLIYTFYLGNTIGIGYLLLYCVLMTIPGDIVLCILAAILGKRLIPLFRAERI